MLWFVQNPNEKLLRFVIIFLWEVIYAHFYNWDSPLDLVPIVYDLIELIIEASLWSKDYSTFDTHPQHKTLFKYCLSHLCDCTCSNVMCVLNFLLIKPKNIFEYFICFLKWFYTFVFLSFCLKCLFVLFFKNWFRGSFARSSRLRASREKCLKEF